MMNLKMDSKSKKTNNLRLSSQLDIDDTIINSFNFDNIEKAFEKRIRKTNRNVLSLKPKDHKADVKEKVLTSSIELEMSKPGCSNEANTDFSERKRGVEKLDTPKIIKRPKVDKNNDFRTYILDNTDNGKSIKGNVPNFKSYDAFKDYLESSLKQLDISVEPEALFTSKQSSELRKSDDLFPDSQSDFFVTSQVIRDIDNAILKEVIRTNDAGEYGITQTAQSNFVQAANDVLFKVPMASNTQNVFKRKNSEQEVSSTGPSPPNLTTKSEKLFFDQTAVSQYRKEIDLIFDKLESSICETAPNQDCFLNNFVSQNVQEKIVNGIDWFDDSFIASVTQNVADKSFGSMLKDTLAGNAIKTVNSQAPINATFVEAVPSFKVLGNFYGLPNKVRELVKMYKGIEQLYDWQDECLKLEAVKNRKNLIYALPTSGGKTLVAEILMLREIMCRKRNTLFVLPYVAIVQEKVWSLSPFAVALDFLIEEYASSKGTYPPRKRRRKNSIYIATIEKALGLINSLHEQGRIEELGLVVVDEIHLIGEQSRGSTLESLLTKLIHVNVNIQIIGMSATIGNLPEICEFLKADVYQRNFRPVELTEYVKSDKDIAKINWNVEDENDVLTFHRRTTFNYSDSLTQIDPDGLGGLVMEVIPKDSCLIFCPSKKSCENVANLLCRVIFGTLKDHRKEEKLALRNALKDESGSLCGILNICIPFGVAYHHSGLTNEERKLIEDGFRSGILSVICCTSTLAAGVNLPAKRVILRKPYIGRDFINLSRYKQMVGRAGRAGFGEAGESILICDSIELPKVRKLLMSPMDRVISSLHETNGKGLRELLLSCISLGMAHTRPQLLGIVKETLMAVQQEKLDINIKKLTDQAISDLLKLGALDVDEEKPNNGDMFNNTVLLDTSVCPMGPAEGTDKNSGDTSSKKRRLTVTNDTKFVISKLGSAAIKGCLELSRAHLLYEDLLKAQECLVLLNDLHLLFLIIPYNAIEQVKPCLSTFYSIFTQLNPKELHTAKVLGFDESAAVRMLSNQLWKNMPESLVNRFYLALILYDLWNEKPVFKVAVKFKVPRGLVQNLMSTSAAFASNVVSFCEELDEFWAFSHLLKGMSQRLAHCCVKDILPLMELPSVKQNRARQLYTAGYTTLQKVAKADPNELLRIEFMTRKVANQLIAAAKMLLLEKVENLREEAEDVLDGVNDI